MTNRILSKTVFRNTTPGLQGYSDSLATGATVDPPNPNDGDNKTAPIAMQSYRDDGQTELWSYVSPDNIETYASELLIQLSPEGMWDLRSNTPTIEQSAPRGKVVMKVNGTSVMEQQVWGRGTPNEPSNDVLTVNKGAWGANNYGAIPETTTPKYGDGIQLAENDTISFEVTPYDHALGSGSGNNGLHPQVYRFKVFAVGTVSGQRFFWTATYRPLDLTANQVAVTFTTPVNGITLRSVMVYCDTSMPFIASRVGLHFNGSLIHEFGPWQSTIYRTRGDLIAIPLDSKLGTGGTLSIRGNPLIDVGGIASIMLLGNLTDLTEAPYAEGYADGYADGLADGLATDQTGPIVQNITPTQGTIIGTETSTTPITFEVADTTGVLIGNVDVTIHFIDGSSVTAIAGGALDVAYNTLSSIVQTNGQLVSISLLPDVGVWDKTISRIVVAADDTAGGPNSSSTTIGSWIVVADDVAPYIDTISPAEGSTILATDPITFNVNDLSSVDIADVTITAHFVASPTVTIWDGSAIHADYDASSTVTQTSPGLIEVSLIPDTGEWPGTITKIVVTATDGAGTPNSSTSTLGSWIISEAGVGGVIVEITDGPLQRWTPVVARVTLFGGGELHVRYVSNSLKFWVYDDQDGFAPNFRDQSSVVEDGDDLIVTILPNGGWWTDKFHLKFFAGEEMNQE